MSHGFGGLKFLLPVVVLNRSVLQVFQSSGYKEHVTLPDRCERIREFFMLNLKDDAVVSDVCLC